MADFITDLVDELLASRNALIDAALESALERGTCGVLVIDGGVDYFEVEVSELVPFAHIFHFPSRAAAAEWVALGCPE